MLFHAGTFVELAAPRVQTMTSTAPDARSRRPSRHGLALGDDIPAAVHRAKRYVTARSSGRSRRARRAHPGPLLALVFATQKKKKKKKKKKKNCRFYNRRFKMRMNASAVTPTRSSSTL